jgi:hypothetical protein
MDASSAAASADAAAGASSASAAAAAPSGAAAASAEDCAELLECARYGETEDVVALLRAGVPADFCDAAGNTALHRAAANGHVAAIAALAAAGARLTRNGAGSTALHWAALNGQADAAKASDRTAAHAARAAALACPWRRSARSAGCLQNRLYAHRFFPRPSRCVRP